MKVLFLQEYIRENHMKKQQGGDFRNVFLSTEGGKILRNLVESEAGLNLTKKDYYVDYAYNLVPTVITRDNYNRGMRYKPPTQKEANEEYKFLVDRILKEKPDIIIPTGSIGCKMLLNKSAITTLRGVPEKITVTSEVVDQMDYEAKHVQAVKNLERSEAELASYRKLHKAEDILDSKTLGREESEIKTAIAGHHRRLKELDETSGGDSHTMWVLPMFSMEYMLVNPNIQNLVEADFITLNKFLQQGDDAFVATPTDYDFVDTIEGVREVFQKHVLEAPVVAWDLETNTLRSEAPGAKPLVISIAVKEEEGFTIPLEHKDFTWEPEELEEIYDMMKVFVANPDIVKVGANIRYDIRFLRSARGFTTFNNHRDTMVMYYLLINQEVEASLRLSDMAYELTSMGGYDKGLEEFQKTYISERLEEAKVEVLRLRAEENENHKVRVEEEKVLAKAEGRKAVKIDKIRFPTATAPRNEIDDSNFNYEWFPLKEMLHPYASGDVDACLRIHNKLDEMGKLPQNAKLRDYYTNHYPDLSNYLANIESNGIQMDMDYNQLLSDKYGGELERLLAEMRKLPIVQQYEANNRKLYEAGLEEWTKPPKERDVERAKLRDRYKNKLIFNPSPNAPDKAQIYYQMLGIQLPFNREYLKDSTVDNGVLEEDVEWTHYKADTTAQAYIVEHFEEGKDLAKLALAYSGVNTRRQGFTHSLRARVDGEGLLHGGFSPTGTATSRLSSSSPNLQNIPRNTGDPKRFDYKFPIKRQFISRFVNGTLVQFDFSALESRLLALASHDPGMIKAFVDGEDIHTTTAMDTWNLAEDEVTHDIRESAKAVSFGIAYGETPFSFAPKHDMTLKEAEDVFEAFYRNKPAVKGFIDDTHAKVKKDGFVETLQGFRRNLRNIYSNDRAKQNETLRQSVNTTIQGTGAFLTNYAVILIQKVLEQRGMLSRVVLTVHDSIVADCPPEEVLQVAEIGKHVMENLPVEWLFVEWEGERIRFPMEADADVGINYNDLVYLNVDEYKTFASTKGYCKFHNDIGNIKNHKDHKIITDEKAEELTEIIKARLYDYQQLI